MKRGFLNDSIYAVSSQAISVFVGFFIVLVLPKILQIEEYGYYQLFLLYGSYIGFLHFGFNDGMYLFLGGKHFDEIDCSVWGKTYTVVITFMFLFFLGLIIYSLCFLYAEKQKIGIFLAFFLLIENTYKILGFQMMATDKMVEYSKSVVVSKLVLLIGIALCCCIDGIQNFEYVSVVQIVGLLMALLWILRIYKFYFKCSIVCSSFSRQTFLLIKKCIVSGFVLTVSNLLSSFILGAGRFFVEHFWGIKTFAKISFAVTLSMFVLAFISQIGLVLFPHLRRLNLSNQRKVLDGLVYTTGSLCMVCFILFIPIYFFIKIWLPTYNDSLMYLLILFPLSLYDTKTILIYNTYFKNICKQNILFVINIVTVVFAVAMYAVSCLLSNVNGIIYSMFVALTFRSIVLQILVYRYFDMKLDWRKMLFELSFCISLIALFQYWGIIAFVSCFFIVMLIYISNNYKAIKKSFYGTLKILK